MNQTHYSEGVAALRFAGKFLAVASAVVASFWLLGALFRFSKWAGFFGIAVVVIVMYRTAERWVAWLSGLLVFGVLNAVLALITHHAPTNREPVSNSLSILLLIFYALGWTIFRHYDVEHLSVVDRCAVIIYVASAIWPAFTPGSQLGIVTPYIFWGMVSGMAILLVSFMLHRSECIPRSNQRTVI